jgi:hypothetical protein
MKATRDTKRRVGNVSSPVARGCATRRHDADHIENQTSIVGLAWRRLSSNALQPSSIVASVPETRIQKTGPLQGLRVSLVRGSPLTSCVPSCEPNTQRVLESRCTCPAVRMCHYGSLIGGGRSTHNSDEGASTTVWCSAQTEFLVKQEASMLWSAITLTLPSRR